MKRWREVWPWLLATAALLILAASQIEFVPEGERPPSFNLLALLLPSGPAPATTVPASTAQESTGAELDAVLSRLFLWVLLPIALVVYVVAIVTSPRTRRHAITLLVILVVAITLVSILRSPAPETQALQRAEQTGEAVPEEAAPAPAPGTVPEAHPAGPAGWLVWLVAVALALVLLAGLYLLWRRLPRWPAQPLAQLVEQAQGGLEELRGGADLRDVVSRCYVEMCRAVSERQGLQRQKSLTPREFARGLEGLGLPVAEVCRLTQLFERVRYAAQPPGLLEEQEATACLEAIVAAVGRLG